MPRIHWAGMIRGGLDGYQQGDLPPGAVPLPMPGSTGQLMAKAAVFLPLPLAVIFAAMLGKTLSSGQVVIAPLWVGLGVCVGVPGLLLHELLHALPYPKEAVVTIGFYPKALAAVALVSYPISRRRFILMSLLPLVLGVVPIGLFLLTPASWLGVNGFLFGFGVMGLVSPYPDIYNVYQVLRHTPKECQVQFWGDGLYYSEQI